MENFNLKNESIEGKYNLSDLRKKYSQLVIPIVWRRLAQQGIENADSQIGTRETINDSDSEKFWLNVDVSDLQEYRKSIQDRFDKVDSMKVMEREFTKENTAEAKSTGGFNPETGEFEVLKEVNLNTENITDYFNPSTGEILVYTSQEDKDSDMNNLKQEIDEVDYLISSL